MRALLLVDIQNDFCPGGNLAVSNGNEIVPVVNELQKKFDLVVATQDWHPANHKSFASQHEGKQQFELIDLNGLQQVLWPDHAIQSSRGSRFVTNLDVSKVATIFRKGMDPEVDSYSAFFDNGHKHDTGLAAYLNGMGVEEVFVTGLALDYCVKFTALDAVAQGFRVNVVVDACRAVNMNPTDGDEAIKEMFAAGISTCLAADVQRLK